MILKHNTYHNSLQSTELITMQFKTQLGLNETQIGCSLKNWLRNPVSPLLHGLSKIVCYPYGH